MGKLKQYTIPAGCHSPRWWRRLPKIFYTRKAINLTCVITPSMLQSAMAGHEINKVGGIGIISLFDKGFWRHIFSGKKVHHYNSTRVGWTPNIERTRVIITMYHYVNGVNGKENRHKEEGLKFIEQKITRVVKPETKKPQLCVVLHPFHGGKIKAIVDTIVKSRMFKVK